ncbi:MAG: exodeoxyribonuclease III [Cyanobacteria bacterium J083]|nr:MAG: exodeoxyribonuclease III [Cyanobacteria bacterium J083]
MKIATWNVNSIRTRQGIVVDWLKQHQVDILCLQETKVIDADFPRQPFSELGYNLYISGQKAYNGVAIFSRQELTDVSCGFSPIIPSEAAAKFDEQKRLITGVIDNLRIVNVYVPNGAPLGSEKYEYKLAWLKMLKTYLLKLRQANSLELCVSGDFNIAPRDKDIYTTKNRDKHIMSSPAEREALQDLLSIGLADAFRKFTCEPGHYTWWDYRAAAFQRNRGWRIDHHYLTPIAYEQAISCTIDVEPRKLERPSDHVPVILELP